VKQTGCPEASAEAGVDDAEDENFDELAHALEELLEEGEVAAADVPEVRPDDAHADPGSSTSHDRSSQHRRVAMTWLSSMPFGYLLLMRVLMEPQRVYVKRMLTRGGHAFEEARAGRVARRSAPPAEASANASTGDGEPAVEQRADAAGEADVCVEDYRVLSAGAQVHEKEFCDHVRRILCESSIWQLLPQHCSTVVMTSIAFRMASASLCVVMGFSRVNTLRTPSRPSCS